MEGHRLAADALDESCQGTALLEVSIALAEQAGALAQMYEHRGYDDVHPASALDFQRGFGPVTFLEFDDRLTEAAAAAGLVLYAEHPALRNRRPAPLGAAWTIGRL